MTTNEQLKAEYPNIDPSEIDAAHRSVVSGIYRDKKTLDRLTQKDVEFMEREGTLDWLRAKGFSVRLDT
jgi:hypothetical protein